MRSTLRFCLAAGGLLACQSPTAPLHSRDPLDPGFRDVVLTRFGHDSSAYATYSGLLHPENIVVSDAGAWSDLWRSIHAGMDPVPTLPEVDFSREVVVAAALGSRPSGGYDILLASATVDSLGILIQVQTTRPGSGCGVTLALTQPVDIARMDREAGPVRFVTTDRVRDCTP